RGRQGLRGGDAGRGAAGGAAGVRPRLEPVGRGRLAAPQARRVAQPDVPGPGGVAPGVPLGHRPPPTEAAPGSILLCTSRVEAQTYLTAFAQRSVSRKRQVHSPLESTACISTSASRPPRSPRRRSPPPTPAS